MTPAEKLFAHYDETIKERLAQYGEVKTEDKDFGRVYTAGADKDSSALVILDWNCVTVMAGYGQGENACLVNLSAGYPIELAFKTIEDSRQSSLRKRGA